MVQVAAYPGASLVGTSIGPYRLDAYIGHGGMSSVYRATQTGLNRQVAVKLLPSSLAADRAVVQQFLQEARAAAALQHPNIIAIYDSGQASGFYYITMRYVEGLPLSQVVPAGGMPVARVVEIVQQLASALDYAHRSGIIHRDVSGGNVMLEAGDHVTLMDFGIAQAGVPVQPAGSAMGTLEYLAPEQARGGVATVASEVYALGVLTYELLTGRLPFEAHSDQQLLMQHVRAQPAPVRTHRPDMPGPVDDAIMRCLAKRPADRYASAGAFAAVLSAALADAQRRTQELPVVPPLLPRTRELSAPTTVRAPAKAATAPQRRYRTSHKLRWVAFVVVVAVAAAVARVTLFSNTPASGLAPAATPTSAPSPTVQAVVQVQVPFLPALTQPDASPTPIPAAAPAATARPLASATPRATATPIVPPQPASASDAVQGYYDALYRAITTKNVQQYQLAYDYLSSYAQAQLPFDSFVHQYNQDSGIAWHWDTPTYTPDKTNATVPVDLTEFRKAGNVKISFEWRVIHVADGWHLESMGPAQP